MTTVMRNIIEKHKFFVRIIFLCRCSFKIIPLIFYKRASAVNFSVDTVVVFDTSIASKNLGDEIIVKYCNENLRRLHIDSPHRLPTHVRPQKKDLDCLKSNVLKLIMGTNIISPQEDRDYLWKKPALKYLFPICLLGCGLNSYDKNLNLYSRIFYRKNLSQSFLHSVRDSVTENALKAIGIENVINTACPTMWNLSPDFCKTIPHTKANVVATTLTDYDRDSDSDFFMLDTLLENYGEVFLWLQGDFDAEYLQAYPEHQRLRKIPHTLRDYERFIENTDCDYIGTRLHAGIRALNARRRTMIVAVDDRATQIARDTNLPVMPRDEIKNRLNEFIHSDFSTEIKIPLENIQKWKNQFLDMEKTK